ncbi:MAG: hypothetical protein R3214_10050 [Christiangramia sp.]|nr:hypothetical protein [Christiangramia sp.]
MKKAFEKYFLSVVFILLAGLINANSVVAGEFQDQDNAINVHVGHDSSITNQLLLSSSSDTFIYSKLIMEVTENEEQESFNKNNRKNQLLIKGSILPAFFYVFAWESLFTNSAFSPLIYICARPVSCKQYIQFEVFRI